MESSWYKTVVATENTFGKTNEPKETRKKMLEKLSLSESIVSVLMFDQSIEMFWEIKWHVGFLKLLWPKKLNGNNRKEQNLNLLFLPKNGFLINKIKRYVKAF